MVEAAGRLDRDHRGSERREAGGEFLDAGAVAGDGEGLLGRKHVNVELVLRDVDADDDGVHPVPSLPKRASLAAPATVRVRWNDGRGPPLTHGLDHPRGLRSRARHRTGQNSRSSDSRLTRGRGPRSALTQPLTRSPSASRPLPAGAPQAGRGGEAITPVAMGKTTGSGP